ncbi:putative hscarg dehydrogenase [Sclerotinia borealis F-4128]|uniref:Putative hscarg dehydrogenase n=1 Tax=Sclerotinia borealis (strain F-4128) TaxID=1432307 RepID=W9CJK2_SCLBF|nr:putative hscarg dehydrogenase [Sclerotinia borealis F-4128]
MGQESLIIAVIVIVFTVIGGVVAFIVWHRLRRPRGGDGAIQMRRRRERGSEGRNVQDRGPDGPSIADIVRNSPGHHVGRTEGSDGRSLADIVNPPAKRRGKSSAARMKKGKKRGAAEASEDGPSTAAGNSSPDGIHNPAAHAERSPVGNGGKGKGKPAPGKIKRPVVAPESSDAPLIRSNRLQAVLKMKTMSIGNPENNTLKHAELTALPTNQVEVILHRNIQYSQIREAVIETPENRYWHPRVVSREDISKLTRMATKGVEVVQADFDDRNSLLLAFEGAAVIYSNTGFFVHLFTAISKGAPPGRTVHEYAFDREVAQGINIAEAAASPTILQTLERFIYSSLSDATKWSKGKYTTVYHFDSKAETIRLTQSRFPELAAKMSTLQVGHYVTNWKAFPSMAPQKQPDGSFLVMRPLRPDSVNEFMVAHRDTGVYVKALLDMPAGTNLIGVSQRMTWAEWTKVWGATLGVQAEFKHVSEEVFWEGVPEEMRELQDAWDYADEFGHTGGDPDVLRPEQLAFKIPVTSMEEYIRSEGWSSVLNA